jgi:rhamnogalacturonyl hydrolase YesR
MKLTFPLKFLLRIASFCTFFALSASAGTTLTRDQIIAEGEKVADAQLADLANMNPDINWVAGVMWAGLADFSHVSSRDTYSAAIEQMGDECQWTPRLHPNVPNHADDLCICQTFLDAYATKNDPARLLPSQKRIDAVSDYIEQDERPYSPGAKDAQLTWWWCDALFMAPASQARLSVITGNPKYLDAMDEEWWRTTDLLYDQDEHLFYRDTTFFDKKTKNGKKVFWSRGNGWVFAGLARTLTYIPADYPSRPKYINLFREMAEKFASLQQPDGTWRPSLLDPDEFPDSEMSGTALDCFAFAWGIENGILDRATYLPHAEAAWAALMASLRPDGVPGYVQNVGAAPAAVSADGTQLYATGALLMAACELSKLAPITVPSPPQLTAVPAAQ